MRARDHSIYYRYTALALCLVLAGCGPILSQQTMDEVDRSITFEELLQNPVSYKGRVVLVGGRIIRTTVKENETWIEVLQLPLGSRDRPQQDGHSSGRFLARFNGFQDPDVYAPDVYLTMAGVVEGVKPLPIGQAMYNYPVLNPIEIHVWRPGEGYPPFFSIGFGVGTVF